MKLYERDYFKLTDKESTTAEKILGKEKEGKTLSFKRLLSIPKAYYFNTSYFPNNMLDIDELKNGSQQLPEFLNVIEQIDTTERNVQSFISKNRSFFIPASLLAYYDFGHHGAFLFPEFPLSTNHVVDYLIIGKNSGGHEFIFVELEAVKGKITRKDGSIGESIRKGIKQVEDWDLWLEKNYSNMKSVLDKYRNPNEVLPDEFFEYDKSRIHFVVIAGRRKDFSSLTYRKRRKLLQESNVRLLHYDNLIDCANSIIEAGSYCRCVL